MDDVLLALARLLESDLERIALDGIVAGRVELDYALELKLRAARVGLQGDLSGKSHLAILAELACLGGREAGPQDLDFPHADDLVLVDLGIFFICGRRGDAKRERKGADNGATKQLHRTSK